MFGLNRLNVNEENIPFLIRFTFPLRIPFWPRTTSVTFRCRLTTMKPLLYTAYLSLCLHLSAQPEKTPVSGEQTFENTTIEAGSEFLAMNRNSLLVFRGKNVFNGSYRGGEFGAQVGIKVESGELLFNGIYNCALTGGDKGRFFLERDTRLLFGPDAQMNQQMSGMIRARPMFVHGKGNTSILELDRGFNADHMGWPDLDRMVPNGFSVLFLEDAHLISHATHSLPSVHKFSGNGNHTHHGVLVFQGQDSQWQIRTSPQIYDGVLGVEGTLRLHTEKDLLFTGHYFEDSACYFGAWTGQDGTSELIKSGPGKLVIMGTQLYAVPFITRVTEGEIIFRTPPHDPGHFVRTEFPNREWAHLEIVVENKGVIRLNPTQNVFPAKILRLQNQGQTFLGSVRLFVQQDMTLEEGGTLEVPLSALATGRGKKRKEHPIQIGGTLTLGGEITVTGPAQKGRVVFARAKTIRGQALWNLPAGMRVEQTAHELVLIHEESKDLLSP